MAVNERDWVMVRLTRQTHAKLVAFAKRFGAWCGENPNRVGPCREDGMALTVAVNELLRREDVKAARARASRQRKAMARRRAADIARLEALR